MFANLVLSSVYKQPNARAKPCMLMLCFVLLMACEPKIVLCVQIVNIRCSGLSAVVRKPVIISNI